MRRFESSPSVRLHTPAGRPFEAWVAGSFRVRLTGLAGLAGLPPGRALLLPGCRSLHTVGMRFAIDVAFVSWPPVAGGCRVVALRAGVPPFRVVVLPGLPRRGIAALEFAAGTLVPGGVRPGDRLSVDRSRFGSGAWG